MKIIEANGARIPALGLGTYTLKDETCVRLVAQGIEDGYRHIDTARMYGNEAEVGKGIAASGIDRGEIFLTTKVWWTDLSAEAFADSARAAVDAIGLGPVDLLLIHWPNRDVPLEETIEALNATLEQGLTRAIGVANFTAPMLDEAAALSPAPLACNQVEYHPFLSQESILGACRRHGMAMIAYSPIGQGGELLAHPVIAGIAATRGRTPAQIVLRWELEQDIVGAIPRTSNPARLKENLDVFDFELTEEEHKAITALTTKRQRLVDPAFAPNWDRI